MSSRSDAHLFVLLDGRRVATLTMHVDGRYTLTYEDEWRYAPTATPLSLAMPLRQRTHDDPVVRAFLSGLLPDNDAVLEWWARAYQVSARNPFALLQHVGEDCAGAAALVTPDRYADFVSGGGVQWLTEEEIAERIRVLRQDPSAWHMASDSGQFSLAGAQAKTALYQEHSTGRWGLPWGAVPTTHIVKPAIAGLDDHDLNEHLCLTAARELGLTAAASDVVAFGDERAIVVTRYDRRVTPDGRVTRVHQEDVCQALGVPPDRKYQSEGGPTPEQIIDLPRGNISPRDAADSSVTRFADFLAFNWIIAGTDAHAKNYSLLLSGSDVRLAPAYDVASALPYDGFFMPRLRMAMKIGGEYGVERISGRHWRRFAEANGLNPDKLLSRIDAMAQQTPVAFAAAASEKSLANLNTTLPERLVERLTIRAESCRTRLAS